MIENQGCQMQNPNSPTTGGMSTSGLPPAPIPEWQERQFRNLLHKLAEWRGDDHEDAIVLCRSEIIAILESVKSIRNKPATLPKISDREEAADEVKWLRHALERIAQGGNKVTGDLPAHPVISKDEMCEIAREALSPLSNGDRGGAA